MSLPDVRLGWGILATGRIAAAFARGVRGSARGRLVAVGSRSLESAERFAAEHAAARAHGSYEALLADPDVQAVYIATPHPQHIEWVVRAAEAGKHVLCEKPIGLNQAEAMVMGEAARRAGVALMEAWMYRFHPLTLRVVELVRSGAIGRLRHVQASFSYHAGFDAASRTWNNALAGGGILDVGGYPVSYARLLAGAAHGQPFLNPTRVAGVGDLHPQTGIDVHAAAVLAFAGGITAEVSTGVGLHQEQIVRIYGTEGWLAVPSPYVIAPEPAPVTIQHFRGAETAPSLIEVAPDRPLYAYEADAFAEAVLAGQREVPGCSWADTMGNLAVLDAWRRDIGLLYDAEKPENATTTLHRRPLRVRSDATMRYGEISGLSKPVSRLVLGVDHPLTMPLAAALFDDYIERGGNTFDTAYIYREGVPERLLGHWMRHRGVREQVVVVGKGAHTPYCTPEALTRQLLESLERLQTDRVDVYLLHRDNPEVPVGEFVDVLDEHARAGRIGVFGGSNWSIERVTAANRYARRKGRQAFSVLSNQLSLARLVRAPWAGCLSAGDVASRRWLQRHRFPLLPWSSQARGYFSDAAPAEVFKDGSRFACWEATDNAERRARARQLAQERHTTAHAIATAWVLHQPFPTFPLIGPRSIEETVAAFSGLSVELTPREVRWLNLEA